MNKQTWKRWETDCSSLLPLQFLSVPAFPAVHASWITAQVTQEAGMCPKMLLSSI